MVEVKAITREIREYVKRRWRIGAISANRCGVIVCSCRNWVS